LKAELEEYLAQKKHIRQKQREAETRDSYSMRLEDRELKKDQIEIRIDILE